MSVANRTSSTPNKCLTEILPSSYQNQKEVAEGIKRAFKDIPGLKREDLFIVSRCQSTHVGEFPFNASALQTSKLWNRYSGTYHPASRHP